MNGVVEVVEVAALAFLCGTIVGILVLHFAILRARGSHD